MTIIEATNKFTELCQTYLNKDVVVRTQFNRKAEAVV